MNKKFSEVSIRIFLLTGVFFVLINIFGYFFNSEEINASNNNKENFTSNDISVIGNVGVAIATNVGTRQTALTSTPVNIYKDVFTISQIISESTKVQDELISKNMLILNEYLNVLKTDVKALLASSNDRSSILNAFISQLEYRYKVGTENVKTLNLQKTELTASYNTSSKKLETIKQNISNTYGKLDTDGTVSNIDEYLKVMQEVNYARTYIVFINKFLNGYTVLNNYNKLLLDTLINNKEILVKNSQVVIPDSGSGLLKDLNLIYDEADWKSQ